MFNKLMRHSLLILSLFLVSLSPQAFAVDNSNTPMATMQMIDKININTATSEQFSSIKGIGVKKAQAIVSYRNDHGKFTDLEQIMSVKGIGEGIFKKIAPYLTL